MYRLEGKSFCVGPFGFKNPLRHVQSSDFMLYDNNMNIMVWDIWDEKRLEEKLSGKQVAKKVFFFLLDHKSADV